MADLSVTAGSVAIVAGANVQYVTAGVTITAGQSLYQHTDGSAKLADADVAGGLPAACIGISLNGASSGQPVAYASSGSYTAGGTVVVGKVYVVSATAGGIAPSTDLATGMYTTIIGVGISASVIALGIKASGVQVP